MPCWCFPFRRNRSPSPSPTPLASPHSEGSGLKVLYDGAGSTGVDIVAVHGLNGHRERSWTAENGTNWLRDLLPVDVPNIRVLTWGWSLPTKEDGSEMRSQQSVSEKLIHDLWDVRSSTNSSNRPIVFIAHSAGGPIVKSALIYSNSASETTGRNLRSIKDTTRGAIFMGTAELDSRLGGLKSYLASVQGSGQEHSEIYQEAHWLVDTLKSYPPIGEQIWTLFIHERPGSTTEVKSEEGRSSHVFIKASHGDMIKFDRVCEGYLQIKEHLMFVDLKAEIGA